MADNDTMTAIPGSELSAAIAKPDLYQTTNERALVSEALFRGKREVIIRHGNQDYCLRITKQDKLILTK